MDDPWSHLTENAPIPCGLVQVDLAGSSNWPAPDAKQQETKTNLQRLWRALAGVFNFRELNWEGDGGCYLLPISDPRTDFDTVVHCGLTLLHSLELINNAVVFNTLGFPIEMRVSCHAGLLMYSADLRKIHGSSLNWFRKNERAVSAVNSVTITGAIYGELYNTADTKRMFVEIGAQKHKIDGQTVEVKLYRFTHLRERANPLAGQFARNRLVAASKKRAVADYVIDNMIHRHMNVFLDAGTSVHHVAESIVDSWRNNTRKWDQLWVATHSMPCWLTLRVLPRELLRDLWLIGGNFNDSLQAFVAPDDVLAKQLSTTTPHVSIVGIDGIDENGVYYCDAEEEFPIKKQMTLVGVSRCRVILAHDAKIGHRADDWLCDLDKVFVLSNATAVLVTNKPTGAVTPGYRAVRTLIREKYGSDAFIEV